MKILEGVGDKYAEKAFGIKTKFSDFEQIYNQTLAKQKESPIAEVTNYYKTKKTYIFKNPKSLKGFDNEVRAIGDIDGNLYICLDNINITHGDMSKALFGISDIYAETDKYIFLHRVKKTKIFGLSDSTDCFIDSDNLTQEEYLENMKKVKTIIDKIKHKNPQYKILDIYYEYIRGSMLDDDKYKNFL